MPLTARGIPRFLPTLTEVVHSPAEMSRVAVEALAPADGMAAEAGVMAAAPVMPVAPVVASNPSLMDDVDFQARLEGRVRQLVASALAAQVDRVTGQLMGELEPAVRQLVREGLMQERRFSEPP